MTTSLAPAKPRVTPIKLQLATLADAARINMITSNALMAQLARVSAAGEPVDDDYVRAAKLTNERLVKLLADAPTLYSLQHG